MTAYPVTLDHLEDGHALILGTTGSGKTYQLRGMLEQLRGADRRVGAVDKLGNHWGLTLGADGESAGLDFIIFGGKRAQVPMSPDQGAKLGRLFVERNIPAIFDVSQWHADDQQRWVADFADAVFVSNEAALHLAFDEAQSWVPQGGGGDAFRSVQRLAEQGRGNGVRLLLSCQRLSRLDATVRGMAGLVLAMRQTGVLDRKAVKDLISADAHQAALIERDLPKMPVGTGYLWSAGDVELLRISFPANATFDSSRTPRHGDTPPAPIAVSSALVEELKAALTPTRESQKSGYPDDTIPADPMEAYEKGSVVGAMLIERDERIAELEATVARLQHDRETLEFVARRALELGSRINTDMGQLLDLFDDERLPVETMPPGSKPPADNEGLPSTGGIVPASPVSGGPELPPRRVKILGAIAWAAEYLKRPDVPRAIVAWIADTSSASSSYANDLGAMRSAGLIDYPSAGLVALTEEGRSAAPFVKRPRTREELWGGISVRLPPRQIAIVDALWNGRSQSREQLAYQTGASPTSSSYSNDLGRLRSRGLIDYPEPGTVALTELLR